MRKKGITKLWFKKGLIFVNNKKKEIIIFLTPFFSHSSYLQMYLNSCPALVYGLETKCKHVGTQE